MAAYDFLPFPYQKLKFFRTISSSAAHSTVTICGHLGLWDWVKQKKPLDSFGTLLEKQADYQGALAFLDRIK